MMGGMTPVVRNLLIINVIMYVITMVIPMPNIDLGELLALHYFESEKFRPHQLVTYMFLHGSIMHIFFNMFAVFMFGRVLEQVWGAKRFLIYYFITGIGAALIHMGYQAWEFMQFREAINEFVANPSAGDYLMVIKKHLPGQIDEQKFAEYASDIRQQWESTPGMVEQAANELWSIYEEKLNVPTVGASGAVFGLLLAFGMLFPNTELMMIFLPIPIKAKYFVMLYAGLELYLAIQNNPGDNVAHFAHLGGALFGFILVKIWDRDRTRFY